MADNAELISAVIKYRTAKEKLKQEYRHRMHTDLLPEMVEVGRQIAVSRAAGATVDAIAADFGTKNRTFIYAALTAYNATLEPTLPDPEPEENEVLDTPTYVIQDAIGRPGAYHVTVGDVTVGKDAWIVYKDDYGDWVYPDAWFTAKGAERALYKQIIQEIEGS